MRIALAMIFASFSALAVEQVFYLGNASFKQNGAIQGHLVVLGMRETQGDVAREVQLEIHPDGSTREKTFSLNTRTGELVSLGTDGKTVLAKGLHQCSREDGKLKECKYNYESPQHGHIEGVDHYGNDGDVFYATKATGKKGETTTEYECVMKVMSKEQYEVIRTAVVKVKTRS